MDGNAAWTLIRFIGSIRVREIRVNEIRVRGLRQARVRARARARLRVKVACQSLSGGAKNNLGTRLLMCPPPDYYQCQYAAD